MYEELEKLNELKEKGVITPEEFEAQKAKILSGEEKPKEGNVLDFSEGAPKTKLLAGIFALVLGSLGVHNFYLGNTQKAVIQLLLTLIGGWFTFGIAPIAAWCWAIVEGIYIFTGKISTDAKGNKLI